MFYLFAFTDCKIEVFSFTALKKLPYLFHSAFIAHKFRNPILIIFKIIIQRS